MTSPNQKKLETLCSIEGFEDVMEMLEEATFDSVVPAICKNPDCDYCESLEPDQGRGWCPECETNTLVSCLVLAGII